MHKLDKVRVEGYKSIRHLELELGQLSVLIGANGSGKSNFMSLFKLVQQIAAGHLQNHVSQSGGSAALLHFGPKLTSEMLVSLEFGDTSYCCMLAPSNGSRMFFHEEFAWSQTSPDAEKQTFDLGTGHFESQLNQKTNAGLGPMLRNVRERLAACKVYHFQDATSNARIRLPNYINDNEALHQDGANLAAFLHLLQQQHAANYDLIIKTIRRVAPFFDGFALKPLVGNASQVQLDWREIGTETVFAPSALSDGTLRFMCLATLFLQPALPATILIDEPELGLHPFAISLLAGLLRSASTKSQIIVATQSVDLLNEFEPEQVIVTEKIAGASVFRQLNRKALKTWLKDYSLGELWQKNVIGGGPQA